MLSKQCVKKFWWKVNQKCGKNDDFNVIEKITENDDHSEAIENLIKNDHNSESIERTEALRYNEWIIMKLNNDEIKNFNYHEFNNVKEIGRGSNGNVYIAKYRGENIAFKKFTKPNYQILANEVLQ
ncbi:12603_t:CDS:2 [Gigaspora margarita]|uniref:12603_t:CDS:1 n=1 Tax=Gigaspora margarita TaxID=4874 RepID=A0ABN7VLC4_GIGMA|nr:12603_t:CDS:2 [Gigaspora margarita]